MPSFRLISDIHLEFYNSETPPEALVTLLTEAHRDYPVDYLVLAGDIAPISHRGAFAKLIKAVKDHYLSILYVLGNHEYYGDIAAKDIVTAHRRVVQYVNLCCGREVLILLENEIVTLKDGVRVFGATLWSEVSLTDSALMRDARFISRDEILQIHRATTKALREAGEVDVVITHHLPSFSLIDPKYRGSASTAYASGLHDLIEMKKPKVWMYGHTHSKRMDEIRGTRTYCNPHGYPRENPEWKDMVVYASRGASTLSKVRAVAKYVIGEVRNCNIGDHGTIVVHNP